MAELISLKASELDISLEEVERYAGYYNVSRETFRKDISECINEARTVLTPRACFEIYNISVDSPSVDLGFAKTMSFDLAERLGGCKKAILLAATVGLGIDRLISRYSVNDPLRGLLLQAVGAAAVEAFVDKITLDRFFALDPRDRFSCGYGDLSLLMQVDIFKALQCQKNIGVSLTSSLLMTPTKSITAIIGVDGI